MPFSWKRNRLFTKAQKAEMVRLYADHHNVMDIATAAEATRGAVVKILDAAGVYKWPRKNAAKVELVQMVEAPPKIKERAKVEYNDVRPAQEELEFYQTFNRVLLHPGWWERMQKLAKDAS